MRSILFGFMALFLPMVALAGPPPVCECAVQSLPDHVHPEAIHQDAKHADALPVGHVTEHVSSFEVNECPALPLAEALVTDVPDGGDGPADAFEGPDNAGLPAQRQSLTAPRQIGRVSVIVSRMNPQKVASTSGT